MKVTKYVSCPRCDKGSAVRLVISSGTTVEVFGAVELEPFVDGPVWALLSAVCEECGTDLTEDAALEWSV